jgi:cytochrome c5
MSSEPTAEHTTPDSDATHRQRFGLIVTVVLGLIAAGVSYLGTRNTWVTPDSRPRDEPAAVSAMATDPAWDVELPEGPSRDEFQASCLICHSARLPLGQPKFRREKWAEIVHKMVAVYGASMTPIEETRVVDYLLVVRPPAP